MKCFSPLVLMWIGWWHFTLVANETREVCDLISNKYWLNYLNEKAYGEELSKYIKPGIVACQGKPELHNTYLKKSLIVIEGFLSCQFVGHVLELLVMLDALAADLSDKVDKNGHDYNGFVQQNREFWKLWRYEALPWLIEMRPTITLWTSTFRRMHRLLEVIVKVSPDFEDLYDAVEYLNVHLNDKALLPVDRATTEHEAYTRISLVHASVQHTLYRYYTKSQCKQAEWMKPLWPTEKGRISQSTRTAIGLRMKSAISALTDIASNINLAKLASSTVMIELNIRPNGFVKPGTNVLWLRDGVKTNVYQVYGEIQFDCRYDTIEYYYVLSVKTVLVTFCTYLSRYLQIYIDYVMVKGGERFAKKAKNDPPPLQKIRYVFSKMAYFLKSHSYDHIDKIYQRIENPPNHVGTLSVYDLQLMVNNYLTSVSYILEVRINPIPVNKDHAALVLDELLDLMLYGARVIEEKDDYTLYLPYLRISRNHEIVKASFFILFMISRVLLIAMR